MSLCMFLFLKQSVIVDVFFHKTMEKAKVKEYILNISGCLLSLLSSKIYSWFHGFGGTLLHFVLILLPNINYLMSLMTYKY